MYLFIVCFYISIFIYSISHYEMIMQIDSMEVEFFVHIFVYNLKLYYLIIIL